MCPKCTGAMRRSHASSMTMPPVRMRSTVPFIRLVFQANTMFVSNAWEPEIKGLAAANSQGRRDSLG